MEILFWCILSHFLWVLFGPNVKHLHVHTRVDHVSASYLVWAIQNNCSSSMQGDWENVFWERLREHREHHAQLTWCSLRQQMRNKMGSVQLLRFEHRNTIYFSDLVPPSRKQGIISEGRMLWGDRTSLRDLCERTFLDMAMGSSERLEWIDILLT